MIPVQWEILTALGAVYVAIDDVAQSGPNGKPCSQSHYFPRAQAGLMTFLYCIHDTSCTLQDALPKHTHDTSSISLINDLLFLPPSMLPASVYEMF